MPYTLEQLACWVAAGKAGSILRAAGNIRVLQPDNAQVPGMTRP